MENTNYKEINRELQHELTTATAPVVFEYDDYRAFLNDYYHFHKRTNPAFSLRYFSLRAGYRSSSFFKMVMQAKRKLSNEGILNFARALKLNAYETEFFRHLVQFNQSYSLEQKQSLAQAMIRSKAFQNVRPLDRDKFFYWSQWYHAAIREMVALKGFRDDPEWIAAHLNPRITPEEARHSLEMLQRLGLLKRTSSGRLEQADAVVTSGDQVVDVSIIEFHRQLIEKGREAIERFSKDERQISGVTVSVTPQTEQRIKEILNKVRKDILALCNDYENADRVLQVNFQVFPLSERSEP